MIFNLLRIIKCRVSCHHVGRGNIIDNGVTIVHGKFISIGDGCTIHSGTLIHVAAKDKNTKKPIVVIGDNCHLSFRTWIAARVGITIGDDVLFAPNVTLQDYDHGYNDTSIPIHLQPLTGEGCITIGRGCFLAANVVVTPGVTIGDNVVIGANSVVTHDIPAYSLAVGVPAKVIKQFNQQIGQWELVTDSLRP